MEQTNTTQSLSTSPNFVQEARRNGMQVFTATLCIPVRHEKCLREQWEAFIAHSDIIVAQLLEVAE